MASKKRAHAIDRVLALALEPWAITRPMLAVVARVLGRRLKGDPLAFDFDDDELERRDDPDPFIDRGLAVLPIHGCIAPRMNALSNFSGGTTFDVAGHALEAAVLNPDVQTILLDIDSPGGSVLGASEFAHQVLKARAAKPVIACVNFQCCSAAYWVGSCATKVIAAPSACLGSIGVFTIHEDLSVALEQEGIKLTFVSAGKYKTDGNEAEPLSDTARARLTAQVNFHYGHFVDDVASGRRVSADAVRNGFGEGAVVNADEALALGMVDEIGTLDQTLARLLTPASASPALPTRAIAAAPAPSPDPPQEPSTATGTDRLRARREAERALYALGL
jgi:signal peptide peptidase SppA